MKTVYIAAGGTGGHINGALSLKEVFEKDFNICFISGERYLDYQLFKDEKVKHYPGKPLRSKNPFMFIKNILINTFVGLSLFYSFIKNRPQFIIGTGGYICGPTLLTAKVLMIPIFILEQNAVAGLTNKILAKFSDLVFLSFKETKGISDSNKNILSGNPIRSNIVFNENLINEKINILIFGGSLGATQLEPIAKALSEDEKFNILHQVGRAGQFDLEAANYEQKEYIENMQEAYNWANIIISRSGASSVFELDIVKKPTIFIPFKYAVDNHQFLNASSIKNKKTFPVYIVDPNLEEENLVECCLTFVKEIVDSNNFFPFKKEENDNAALLIKEKIYEYLKI